MPQYYGVDLEPRRAHDADVLSRLLWALRIPIGARVLSMQPTRTDAPCRSIRCDSLWWTADPTHPSGGRLVSIEQQTAPAAALAYRAARFDFSLCLGVVERLDDPEPFFSELTRVAKAGYIECRRSVVQTFFPDPSVRWLVDHECDTLFLREWNAADADVLAELRRRIRRRRPIERSLRAIARSPHLRPQVYAEVVWSGRCKYEIVRRAAS
jgi:Methyltransferase domain